MNKSLTLYKTMVTNNKQFHYEVYEAPDRQSNIK